MNSERYDKAVKDLTPSQAIIVIMIALIEKIRFKQPEDILKFLVCCDQIFDELFGGKKSDGEIRRVKE